MRTPIGLRARPLRRALLLLVVALIGAQPRAARSQEPGAVKAVLVTGASTGIGRAITERLASHGFLVYAGARSQKDLDALNAIPNVHAVRLDVTVASDIAAAAAAVEQDGHGLYGVVNNAGVAVVAPLVEASEADMQRIFDVNVFGPYRITKAFAPMLFASKGRIVNISSLNGIVASPMIGPYSMTKHAIEAYGDGLAAELSRFGVRVSLIEPGNYGTDIGRNLMAHTDTTGVAASRFAPQIRATLRSMGAFESNPRPDAVADAVLDAFTNPNPKMRYLVVPVANQAAIPIRTLFDHIAEMNADQAFSYDRDSLVKMLDDALARAKARR